MSSNSFTIHTELIDGTLEGARDIYLGVRSTCHLYVIPRSEINLANTLAEVREQPAFYILLGKSGKSKPKAYIGQTTDFANRKNDHKYNKDFWDVALVCVSDNHKIYGDDVRFLEYLGISAAQEAGSYELLNGSNPRKPSIAPSRINDMEGFFRDIQLLIRFYGCGIFDSEIPAEDKRRIFYVKSSSRGADGKGVFNPETGEFTLLAGSVMSSDSTPSFKCPSRPTFIQEHCINENGRLVLKHDVVMASPSGASGMILGRSSNGKTDFIDIEGISLKEAYGI